MPPIEVWYQWKRLQQVEDDPGPPRLLRVQGDPYQYEFSWGEVLFRSVEEAWTALTDNDLVDEAIDDEWLLVEVKYTPLARATERVAN